MEVHCRYLGTASLHFEGPKAIRRAHIKRALPREIVRKAIVWEQIPMVVNSRGHFPIWKSNGVIPMFNIFSLIGWKLKLKSPCRVTC